MTTREQIKSYIASQPEAKRADMQELHRLLLKLMPRTKLWFDNGKNEQNKTVTNPTIGYGSFQIKYANGKSKEFFQIGISANTTGISLYVLGLKDKNYLTNTYVKTIGKAKLTGYCIRFKALKGINLPVCESAFRYRVKETACS